MAKIKWALLLALCACTPKENSWTLWSCNNISCTELFHTMSDKDSFGFCKDLGAALSDKYGDKDVFVCRKDFL